MFRRRQPRVQQQVPSDAQRVREYFNVVREIANQEFRFNTPTRFDNQTIDEFITNGDRLVIRSEQNANAIAVRTLGNRQARDQETINMWEGVANMLNQNINLASQRMERVDPDTRLGDYIREMTQPPEQAPEIFIENPGRRNYAIAFPEPHFEM